MAEILIKTPEKNERSRQSDLLTAEGFGVRLISAIPDLQRIGAMSFAGATKQEVEAAWETMRAPYQTLIDYYEHFTEVQPPLTYRDSYHTSWKDMQPYASVTGTLGDKENTIRYLFGHKDADYYRSTFHENAQRLLGILAEDFRLPQSVMDTDLTADQRLEILSRKTGQELFGVRFLPVYRVLFESKKNGKEDPVAKRGTAEVIWNPDDHLNRVGFLKGNRPYYIGSAGSARDLEEILTDTILVTGVQKREGAPKIQTPVFDVDRTLREGHRDDALTPEAVSLLSQLSEKDIPYLLWSRAEKWRINQVISDIAAQTGGQPHHSLYFDADAWPFQTIEQKGGHYIFTPHSRELVEMQVLSVLKELHVSARKYGFVDKTHLIEAISQFVAATNPQTGSSDIEYALQGKCPWFIPLSDAGCGMDPDLARSLLTDGVLFDDRRATVSPAHYLGFNFVHVPSLKSLSRAREFILR